MYTITLKITAEQLTALTSGEATALEATCKLRKTRPTPSSPALDPDEAVARQRCIELWLALQPSVAPARMLKTFTRLSVPWRVILPVVDLALDWNKGRPYMPEWLEKEWSEWEERLVRAEDMWASALEREQYRKRYGLR